jgi:membrane protease YdiL (CAAX protease family)
MARSTEWKRLELFLAIGAAIFLIAVVGAAFVPFSWPDPIRRSAHPTIFVPLALILTVKLLRKDATELPPSELFDPWPIRKISAQWLAAGIGFSLVVALAFVIEFGLRWSPNPSWSLVTTVLMLWAIVLTAAAEEIAFRGYAFWRLTRLIGFWQAQAIIAALFVVSHLTLGGSSLIPALIGNVTGSLLYGVVFARTRGLAAPIALHSGWNIAQHLLLSPLNPQGTPFVPVFPHPPTSREYAAMLATIGAVMVVAAVYLRRGDKSAKALPE